MIVDSLTHVTPDGRWFSTSYDASETRLLREMDRAGVDKAVVVALAGFIDNDFVAQTCANRPDRLIPGASIDPSAFRSPGEAALSTRPLFAEGRFALLKLHPRLHRFELTDARFLAVLEELAYSASAVPVWLDTYLRFPGSVSSRPPVDAIRDLVSGFPSLNFLLLHSCGVEVRKLVEAVGGKSHVLLDISYTMHRYRGSSVDGDLKDLVRFFDRKTTFGSDFPEVSVTEAMADFDSLSRDVAPALRARVLGGNLRKILDPQFL